MDGATTKEVILKLDATAAPNVEPTFKRIGDSAERADRRVRGLGSGLRDLRVADRSLIGLGHGLATMSMIAGGANGKLQTTFSILMGFHAAIQVFRGLSIAIEATGRSLEGLSAKKLAAGRLGAAVGARAMAGRGGLLPAVAAPAGAGTDFVVGGAEMAGGELATRGLLSSLKHPLGIAIVAAVGSAIVLGSKEAQSRIGNITARAGEKFAQFGQGAYNFFGELKAFWTGGRFVPDRPYLGAFGRQERRERLMQQDIQNFRWNLENYQIAAPFREHARILNETGARIRDRAGLMGVFGQGYVQRTARQNTRGIQAILDSALGVDRGAGLRRLLEEGGEFHFLEQRERAVDIGRQMAERTAAGKTQEGLAQQELARSVARRDALAKELDPLRLAQNKAPSAMAEQKVLERELAEATQKVFEAQEKYNEALKESGAINRQNLKTSRDFFEQQQKYFRGIRQQEELKLRDFKSEWGLMDPMRQKAMLTIAQKLAAGPGKEQPPHVMIGPGGKPMVVPGTVGGLTQQELQMGRALFPELTKQYGLKRAELMPGFDQVVKAAGLDVKRQQAEQAEKFFADVKVQMENKIQADIKINEKALAEQLLKIIPDIVQAQQRVQQAMEAELARQHMMRRAAQPK